MHPANDRFLVLMRAHIAWEIEFNRGLDARELEYLVRLFIVERLANTDKLSYAYEIAWVFQRDRGTIRHVLQNLERQEYVERLHGDRRTFYKPSQDAVESWLDLVEHNDDFYQRYHDENCPCVKMVGVEQQC